LIKPENQTPEQAQSREHSAAGTLQNAFLKIVNDRSLG
jgi:hypothetical protein